MKSIFKSVKNWMSGNRKETLEPVETTNEPIQPEASVHSLRPAPTEVQPVARPPAPRRPPPEPERERKPMDISSLYNGPEVKLISRGAKVYGVCPHCEAMWNVRERLTHPSFRRQESGKGLTCPACDKAVGLPANTDLRKLS